MKVSVQHWRHYTLKAGSGQAMAYLRHATKTGLGPFEQATGETDEGAFDALRSKLNSLIENRTRDHDLALDIPSEVEFRYALASLSFSAPVESMLRKLALADEAGVTAGELSDAAGYANYNAANLQLGLAAYAIGEVLGISTSQSKDERGHVAATFLLAHEGPIQDTTGHWTWCPRPAFVRAYAQQ